MYTYGDDSFYINVSVLAQEMLSLDCMVTSTYVIRRNLTMLSARLIFRTRIKHGGGVMYQKKKAHRRGFTRESGDHVTYRCRALYGIDVITGAKKERGRK